MNKPLRFAIAALTAILMAALAALPVLTAQDASIRITKGERPKMGIPDFRGTGDAQTFMGAFNQTLWDDVKGAGLFDMIAKTTYPTFVPQQPSDFQQQTTATANGGGRFMTDWSSPPAQLNYLAFGYTAAQGGVLVLSGWLYDVGPGTANHQVIGKRYLGTVDEGGARKIAHEFAADIIAAFGGKSTFGSHIYFVSSRTGHKEIWVMDPDGKNQRQITHYNSISIEPAVSPDGTKIAFTSYPPRGSPGIFVFSVDPVRDLRFYNQNASVNGTPSFTPDGKQIVYASSAGGRCCRIYIAGLDGLGFRPISSSSAIEVEPKVNPKTGSEIVFVSGRSGPQQIYRMNMDGADLERLTPGNGEASNPAWHPDGQVIAFAWTQGYATGNFNIFTMNVATRQYVQLTHGEGRNENPSWAPDGVHIVFMSTRNGPKQIWSMLADGTQPQRLTTQSLNESPVWGK